MKRRFYVSVLDNNERKVILTGDMLPIEIVVEKTKYISFDIQSNKKIEEDADLNSELQQKIVNDTLYLNRVKPGFNGGVHNE